MITDDAMEVHFCLRLLTGLQPCLITLVLTRPRELWRLQCWSGNYNSIRAAPVNWIKLGCVVSAFPLGPYVYSTPSKSFR